MKTHDRDYFVKYLTSNTAMRIIESLQVKWSSPLLFNDPFDTQIELRIDMKDSEFENAFKDEVIKFVWGNEEPQGDDTHPGFKLMRLLRSVRDRVPREKFESEMESDIKKGAENGRNVLRDESSKWRSFLENNRIFCVAEDHDNLLMWSHYSEMHKGVVIKFKCIPELDTALCAATPINYQVEMPVIASLQDWIKHITGQIRLDFNTIYKQNVYTKSQHWSYEKEWRVMVPKKSRDDSLFEYVSIYPSEIHSIYLGCRISEVDRKVILALIEPKLKQVTVYQASKNETRFALDFKRIN